MRGLTTDTIGKWGLGYAPTGVFAGRITYPIYNPGGELAGFTGRRVDEKLEPKFKNSTESELFKKSELLYGFHLAKKRMLQVDRCYIVEGQHDVLTMHQCGLENTVAPSGTALTIKQIALIKPWTKNIVLLLDGDKPGQAAAIKHITTLLTAQVHLRVVVLPEEEDPDSFLRREASPNSSQGGESKDFIINNEIDFIEFKARYFQKEIETDPARKGELLSEITSDITLINDKNVRLAYTQTCARIFGIKENELNRDIARLREKLKVPQEEGKWFALDEDAEKSIVETKEAYLFSKFEEVMEARMNDVNNYIGMNCATLQKSEILKLKKITRKVIFDEQITEFYDRTLQEETPTVLNLKRLISFGIDVRMRVETIRLRKRQGEVENEDEYDEYTDISYH
jgi:DNA primase